PPGGDARAGLVPLGGVHGGLAHPPGGVHAGLIARGLAVGVVRRERRAVRVGVALLVRGVLREHVGGGRRAAGGLRHGREGVVAVLREPAIGDGEAAAVPVARVRAVEVVLQRVGQPVVVRVLGVEAGGLERVGKLARLGDARRADAQGAGRDEGRHGEARQEDDEDDGDHQGHRALGKAPREATGEDLEEALHHGAFLLRAERSAAAHATARAARAPGAGVRRDPKVTTCCVLSRVDCTMSCCGSITTRTSLGLPVATQLSVATLVSLTVMRERTTLSTAAPSTTSATVTFSAAMAPLLPTAAETSSRSPDESVPVVWTLER